MDRQLGSFLHFRKHLALPTAQSFERCAFGIGLGVPGFCYRGSDMVQSRSPQHRRNVRIDRCGGRLNLGHL